MGLLSEILANFQRFMRTIQETFVLEIILPTSRLETLRVNRSYKELSKILNNDGMLCNKLSQQKDLQIIIIVIKLVHLELISTIQQKQNNNVTL